MQRYADVLKSLAKLYDIENELSVGDRLRLCADMMEHDVLRREAEEFRARICRHPRPRLPTAVYDDYENVQRVARSAIRSGRRLIEKLGIVDEDYRRPDYADLYPQFFFVVETTSYPPVDPKRLFVAVSRTVETSLSDELRRRLFEELEEAEGTCVTGCVTRLMNCLRGFSGDDEESTVLDEYEYEKAKCFHSLNVACREALQSGEGVMESVERAVNDGSTITLIDAYALRILKDYTAVDWTIDNGHYRPAV